MRIAVLNNFFPPRVGGSSHLSSLLAQEYAAAGHSVTVLTCEYEDAPDFEYIGSVAVSRLPAWRMPRLGSLMAFDIRFVMRPKAFRYVFKVLDEFRPDVLHIHGQFMDLAWIASVYARRRRVPLLLSVHTRLESPHRGINALFRLIDCAIVAPIVRLPRPSVVVMDSLMEKYVSARYRIPKERRVGIPVGVAIQPPVPRRENREIRRAFNLSEGPIILSVGHVIALRDRVALVQALPRVLADFPEAQLVVAGSVEYPEFLRVAKDLGVSHAIHSLGKIPKETVTELFQVATLEAHDLQGFGMGTANLEAMVAEVPVVVAVPANNFPGFELQDGKEVVLVSNDNPIEIAESICALLKHPSRAKEIGIAGRKLVFERFSIAAVARQHLETFRKLTDGG